MNAGPLDDRVDRYLDMVSCDDFGDESSGLTLKRKMGADGRRIVSVAAETTG